MLSPLYTPKKKCGREDVYNLVKESLDYEISIENLMKH